jgi:serine/threonine protein kinase
MLVELLTLPQTSTHEPTSARMSLEESLVLGRYRVLLPLDEKKLVKAYLARDEHPDGSDTPVLIKHFLEPLGALSSIEVSELLEELSALEQLRRPGVVALLGHAVIDDRLLTAQELLPGVSLLALCEEFESNQAPFPTQLALYIVRRLLLTLEACHTHPARAFVHGRINLASIHLPRGREPQLSDFCLARLVDDAAEAESVLGYFLTQISYLAPEVPGERPATPQNDTYSLGLVLYRLLSGKNPFQARTAGETLQRVLKQAPAPLVVPGWAGCDQANTILTRALAKHPEQRFQDCRALYDALGTLQTASDESLAAELSTLVDGLGNDWGKVTLMPDSVRRPARPRSRADERVPLVRYFESGQPAFASGLVSEKPMSVSEHTRSDREARRESRPQRLTLGFAALVAAALAIGVVLSANVGRRAVDGPTASASGSELAPKAAASGASPALRACGDRFGRDASPAKAELTFDEHGALSAVRLLPPALVDTQLGACLLDAVWKMDMRAPGAKWLALDLPY